MAEEGKGRGRGITKNCKKRERGCRTLLRPRHYKRHVIDGEAGLEMKIEITLSAMEGTDTQASK